MAKRLRVALVAYDWSGDVRTWSGTPFHMGLGFDELGCEVIHVGPLRRPGRRVGTALNKVRRARGSAPLRYEREPLVSTMLSRQVDRWVDRLRPDLVVAPGVIPVSRTCNSVPLALWVDATVDSMVGYYPSFRMHPRSLRAARAQERGAYRRATLSVFASQWALDAARRDVRDDLGRSVVIPFGANSVPVQHSRSRSREGPLRLLLVGVDWHRKGVDVAIDTLSVLRARGIDARLDVVGATPPRDYRPVPGVTLHPFVDKGVNDGRARLAGLFQHATVFVLPTRYECLGIVLAEAAAECLPLVATDTGGVGTMVLDGVTGVLVPPDSSAEAWADAVTGVVSDPERYAALSAAARRDYETRLNWRTAAGSVLAELGLAP